MIRLQRGVLDLFILIACLALTSACSTLHKDQCEDGQWEHIGRIDGLKGRPPQYLDFHRQACQPLSIDEGAYEKGRAQGISDYCSPAEAFASGKTGQSYLGVCDGPKESEFKQHFEEGRKIFLLQQEKRELEQQIQDERERVQNDKSVINHAAQVLNLLSGTSPTTSLDERKKTLNQEIYALESKSPIEAKPSELNLSGSPSLAFRHTLGAVTGTVIGFGTGHAFQGRYFKEGWKWTLADGAAISAMVALNNRYCESKRLTDGTTESSCRNAWPGVALLAFVGLRVWQSVNLWSYLSGSQYRTATTLFINPQRVIFAHSF